jgi:hypothetical protein
MPAGLLLFVLGVIAGTFVAIGVEMFRYIYFRPRLLIGLDRPEIAEEYSCHSLSIRNEGRVPAVSCQGFITFDNLSANDLLPGKQIRLGRDLGLDPEKFGALGTETVYLNAKMYRDIEDEPLAWSAVGSRSTIDIYPHTGRLLDVCRFIKVQPRQIHIPSMFGWQSLLAVLKPNTYTFTVRVVASTGRDTSQRFQMSFNGEDVHIAAVVSRRR